MDSQSPLSDRYFKISDTAEQKLRGPRSIMFPDDPDGRGFWLEPIVVMSIHSNVPTKKTSTILFCVPNCLEHDSTSPVVVRYCDWNRTLDKELCRKGDISQPTLDIRFKALTPEVKERIDSLLLGLDKLLPKFQFDVEGLDIEGQSRNSDVLESSISSSGVDYCKLVRIMRFQTVELNWACLQDKWTPWDESWRALFEMLVTISLKQAPDVKVIEKYNY